MKIELFPLGTRLSHQKTELSHLSFGHLPFSQREEKNSKAFTLVELIVVITILAILATIAFVSFQNYTVYARDVVRVTDLNNMKSVLEYSYTETGYYPEPDEKADIQYQGTTVWQQGFFGSKVKRATKRLSEAPQDPLNQSYYTYSRSTIGSEYELAGAYEGDEIVHNLVSGAYADNSGLITRLIGNYNSKVKVIKHNNTDYVLALPSLISIDISDNNLDNIIANKLLTYNGFNSLPHSYGNTTPPVEGAFEFIPKKLVVWSGSIDDMKKTGSGFTQLTTGLYSAYLGTNLYLQGDEYKYIDGKDVANYILKAEIEEGNIYRNCKEIQEAKSATQNGCYDITGNFLSSDVSCLDDTSVEKYYCDMQKDGGGWTLYTKIKGNYTFDDAKNCILGSQINNSLLYCRVPFAFGKNKELWYQDITTENNYVNTISEKYDENKSAYSQSNIDNFYKSTYFDMFLGKGSLNDTVWFGLNYSHNHSQCGWNRHPGGSNIDFQGNGLMYMNYDYNNECSGPEKGSREFSPRAGEFYVR